MADDLIDEPPALGLPMETMTPLQAQPGWQQSPTCVRLRVQLERYERFHKAPPGKWLLSTRIARQVVEELRPLLTGPEQQTARIEDLTGLFGLPVELVTDLPQGAVLR